MTLLRDAEKLIDIIESNLYLQKMITVLYELKTEDFYIGAGAITQTVWNILTNRPVNYGIDDIDAIAIPIVIDKSPRTLVTSVVG